MGDNIVVFPHPRFHQALHPLFVAAHHPQRFWPTHDLLHNGVHHPSDIQCHFCNGLPMQSIFQNIHGGTWTRISGVGRQPRRHLHQSPRTILRQWWAECFERSGDYGDSLADAARSWLALETESSSGRRI